MRWFLPDEAATQALGAALTATRPRSAMLHLDGDLGAGKSTLARAMLRALGVEGPIRSPTYTLIERYPLPQGDEAWHLDLYRIGDAAELDFLGLDEGAAALWLVEWPERGRDALPPADLLLRLAIEGAGRRVECVPLSAVGESWQTRLSMHHELRSVLAVE